MRPVSACTLLERGQLLEGGHARLVDHEVLAGPHRLDGEVRALAGYGGTGDEVDGGVFEEPAPVCHARDVREALDEALATAPRRPWSRSRRTRRRCRAGSSPGRRCAGGRARPPRSEAWGTACWRCSAWDLGSWGRAATRGSARRRRPILSESEEFVEYWSEREDSNSRPLSPKLRHRRENSSKINESALQRFYFVASSCGGFWCVTGARSRFVFPLRHGAGGTVLKVWMMVAVFVRKHLRVMPRYPAAS